MATRENGHGQPQGRRDEVVGGTWTQAGRESSERVSAEEPGRRGFYQTAIERRRVGDSGRGVHRAEYGQRGYGEPFAQNAPGEGPSTPRELGYGGQYGDYRGEHRYQPQAQQQQQREPQRPGKKWQKEPLAARDIMTRNPRAVHPESTLRDAAVVMKDENVGVVPVVDGEGRLIGLLTDRDIVVRAAKDDCMPSRVEVGEVMTRDVECVTGDESLFEVIELMGGKQIRRVPVVDRDDRLVGIISIGDVANRADYDEELQEALERISAKRSFWSRIFG